MTNEEPEESEPGERSVLPVHFPDLAELESVYRSDICRGGIFVAMEEPLSLREWVAVEFTLDEWPEGLRVEGEVVRSVREPGSQGTGVAVAFTQPMADLREVFEARLESARNSKRAGPSLETVFSVAPGWDASALPSGDSLGLSLVELADSGFNLERILEVIPESESQIRSRLEDLLEAGLLQRQ